MIFGDHRSLLTLSFVLGVWASAFAGIRDGLESYTPGHLVLLRLLVASGVLAIYALITKMRLPDRQDLAIIVLVGFFGFTVYHVCLTFGEVQVTAGAASLLISFAPVITTLISVFFLHERLRVWGWVGMLISMAGIVFILIGEGKEMRFEPSGLLIILAALGMSLYTVLQKPLLRKYRALEVVTYCIWAGTLFTLVFLPGLGEAIVAAPPSDTLAVVYLGIFPTALAYVAFSYVLAYTTVSLVSNSLYLIPVFAMGIAWVWLREVPSMLSLVGGGVVMIGILLVMR